MATVAKDRSKPKRETKKPKKSAPAPVKAAPKKATTNSAEKLLNIARKASLILKQASDPTRLRILLMLAENSLHVGAICDELGGQSQPAVSHHLALLRHGGMVMPIRQGKNNFYELTDLGSALTESVTNVVELA